MGLGHVAAHVQELGRHVAAHVQELGHPPDPHVRKAPQRGERGRGLYSKTRLLLITTLVAGLAQHLAVLLLRHPLAALLDH